MTAKGGKKSAATVDLFLCPFLRSEFVFSFFLSFFFFFSKGLKFLARGAQRHRCVFERKSPRDSGTRLRAEF